MSIEDVLDEIRPQYLADLKEKVPEMQNLVKNKDWDQLREEFHKLSGTGKTYGFDEISQLGGLAENLAVENPIHFQKNAQSLVDILSEIEHKRGKNEAVDLAENADFVRIFGPENK